MKIFTNEFEDKLVNFIGTTIVVSIILLIAGVVGGKSMIPLRNVNQSGSLHKRMVCFPPGFLQAGMPFLFTAAPANNLVKGQVD